MSPARRRWTFLVGAGAVVLLLVGGRWLALETAERAWAASIEGGHVYVTARDLARLVGGVILLLSVAWGGGNLYLVYRAIGSVQLPRRLGDLEIVEAVPQRVLLVGTLASGLLFGFILALGTGDWWMSAVLAARPAHFGAADPLLHHDLGYYLGQLPWAMRCQNFALLATTMATVLVGLLYVGIGSLRFSRWRPRASPYARTHLGVLLACLALTLTWGAVLDPPETVAGLHGALDRGVLDVRLPGAAFVAVLAVATTVASLVWAVREKRGLLVASWGALLALSLLVYVVLPAVLRTGGVRGAGADGAVATLAAERQRLEQLAFATEWLEERPPQAFPSLEAAAAALPAWDVERVVALARGRWAELLGPRGSVAGGALSPRRLSGGRAAWLIAPAPDLDALARTQPPPSWTEIHRGAWARAGRPVAALETDSGLTSTLFPVRDSVAWFGAGFRDFAVAAPDTWPATRAGGIPLAGRWRRMALAWSLQSPELAHAETDGLLLLWRRDVADRLGRLAPFASFEPPTPLVADGALWWISYGYLAADAFPVARRLEVDGRSARYFRAGLLGTVRAASGDTRLYLAPGADSLAVAWARLFAPLVRPSESIPSELRSQLPYPHRGFRIAAALLAQARADSGRWTPRPREPFELVGPGLESSAPPQLWIAQGFEAGVPAEFVGLLAGTMSAGAPRLLLWRPRPAVRLPGVLVGSSERAPGVLRFWDAGGALFSAQGQFVQPVTGNGLPRLTEVYLTWGDRSGVGATPGAALRDVLASGPRGAPGDTSLAARWEAARRVAAQADAALAAGDLEAFGRYYTQLKELLELGRRKLAPPPEPR